MLPSAWTQCTLLRANGLFSVRITLQISQGKYLASQLSDYGQRGSYIASGVFFFFILGKCGVREHFLFRCERIIPDVFKMFAVFFVCKETGRSFLTSRWVCRGGTSRGHRFLFTNIQSNRRLYNAK